MRGKPQPLDLVPRQTQHVALNLVQPYPASTQHVRLTPQLLLLGFSAKKGDFFL